MTEKYYVVLVTRDITESARIPVLAATPMEACEKAISAADAFSHLFTPNDNGGVSMAYLGDEDEDWSEVDAEVYKAILEMSSAIQIGGAAFEAMVAFMQSRIENGDIDAETMARRLVRYALTPPDVMAAEFSERMAVLHE